MSYYTSNASNPYIKPNTTNVNSNKDTYSLDVLATYTKFDLLNGDIFTVSNYTILKKYELLLKSNGVKYTLSSEEKYRPELVSNNLYGTPNLWYLILFMNNLERACKLDMDEIIVLLPTSLSILSQIYSTEKEELDNKNNPINGEDLTLSTSRYANIPKYKIQKRYKAIVNNEDDSLNINKNVLSTLLHYSKIKRNASFNYAENINGFAYLNNTEKYIDDINNYINEYNSVNNENINLKFKIISKKSEIISFKPCGIGNISLKLEGTEYLNKTYSLPNFNNTININNNRFVISSYKDLTNSLLVKIILNNTNTNVSITTKIKYARKEITTINNFKLNSNIFYHYINIDDIYGDIDTIEIICTESIKSYSYNTMSYETYNISTNENDILNVEINYSNINNIKMFTLLISKWFKQYRNLLESDIIVEKEGMENLEIVNSNNSRSYIAAESNNINNDTNFMGNNFFDLDINSNSNDFSLYCLLGADSFKLNGSMGLFFKLNKETKTSYLYTITKKYNNVENVTCYLSGLYKLYYKETNYKNIKCDSNGYNVIKAELLSSNSSHYLSGNNNDLTSLKIITEKANIKIYGNETDVLINFTDPVPIEKPDNGYKHGIYIFNLSNPIIRDLTIHELKYL